ncbi:MAG: long-chain fatty acid--CoA ligase [Actinomycetota bacterium]|nr:long-chain fatty acid--CoA ligase [Actinomycetota bacterium]
MRNGGIGSWPARRARMSPGAVAVIGDDGVEITYAALDERCRRTADVLEAWGVGRGDRVAYLGQNDPALYDVLFAATSLGAVFVPLNWRLATPELAYIVGDCGAGLLVHAADHAGPAAELAAGRDGLRAAGLDELAAAAAEAPGRRRDEVIGLDEPAAIIYTSGTTGRPKGATLTHGNITWNCVNVLIDTGLASTDRSLVCAPLFHVAALNMISMPAFMTGGTVRVMAGFEPGAVLAEIERLGVTTMFGVPAMFAAMAQHPAWETTDLTCLTRALCGGAPVPLALIETYQQRGIGFLQGYGMTEASPGALFMTAEQSRAKPGTAGVPQFFTDVRVVRSDGTDVEVGERGEVLVSGPNVMAGYWGLPDATAAAIDDGWFRSGDVATVDDDGFVTIVDRIKDMYISGGENVYPAEVEDALHAHPAVADCAVIGVADDRWGEAGRAVVVLRPGHDGDEAALLAHLDGRLARYKIPRSVHFVDEIPRSGAGKILKELVRRDHGDTPENAHQEPSELRGASHP